MKKYLTMLSVLVFMGVNSFAQTNINVGRNDDVFYEIQKKEGMFYPSAGDVKRARKKYIKREHCPIEQIMKADTILFLYTTHYVDGDYQELVWSKYGKMGFYFDKWEKLIEKEPIYAVLETCFEDIITTKQPFEDYLKPQGLKYIENIDFLTVVAIALIKKGDSEFEYYKGSPARTTTPVVEKVKPIIKGKNKIEFSSCDMTDFSDLYNECINHGISQNQIRKKQKLFPVIFYCNKDTISVDLFSEYNIWYKGNVRETFKNEFGVFFIWNNISSKWEYQYGLFYKKAPNRTLMKSINRCLLDLTLNVEEQDGIRKENIFLFSDGLLLECIKAARKNHTNLIQCKKKYFKNSENKSAIIYAPQISLSKGNALITIKYRFVEPNHKIKILNDKDCNESITYTITFDENSGNWDDIYK